MNTSPLCVSFIVPVRNDAVRLDRCLKSIRKNAVAEADTEIIVIDNRSSDGSGDVAAGHGARVLVRDHQRVSELRNIGAAAARGEILAFVDADNEIVHGWTAAAVQALREEGVVAVGAPYHAPPAGTGVQHAYGFLRGRARGQQETEWLGTGNLAMWKGAFKAIGGFDASLATCEDVDLCNRLRKRGGRLLSDERLASVHHGDPRTLGAVFLGELWRGRDNLRVSFRPPLSWRTIVSALVPVADVAMMMLVLAGAIQLARGSAIGGALLLAGICGVLAGASLKVIKAVMTEGAPSQVSLLDVIAVAVVYDVARALALFARIPHRRAKPVQVAA